MLHRRGFTLFEMLLVLVILTGLTLFAMPKFAGLQERMRLTGARRDIEAAVATARAAAIQKGRTSTLTLSGNTISVTVTSSSGGTQTTVLPSVPLDSVYSVTVKASDPTLTFDMRGFLNPRLAATGKFVLTGRSRKDSVCLTTAGAIMPRGCSL